MVLRPYQRAAVTSVLDRLRAGNRATLLVLPTGCGKTVVFAELVRLGAQHGRRMLVLAHRTELLDQALVKLQAVGVDAAIEQGDRRAGDAQAVVASVQTLRGARLRSFAHDAFALIVVDEAHHATAASYTAILEHFAPARVVGVTATPDRGDGEALGQAFQSVAYRYELRAAIRDGYLAPIRARRVQVEGVDLGDVHTRAGDLDPGELATVLLAEAALHGVAVPLLELAGARPTILFAADVAHARAMAEVLNRYEPDVARAVDGKASATERAAALADFRAGRFRVLVNCALFVEGFDEPNIACVAIARPTKSRALYAQMIGRGTRLAPDKADCLVVDFTATAGRHRLVGPADVLAGREVDPETLEGFDLLAAGADVDVDQALADVEQAIRDRAITAIARYRADEIDPFLGDMPAAPSGAWAGDIATAKQVEALDRAGLKHLPATLTKGDASRWLEAIRARAERGLATLRQARLLHRYGQDARAMSFTDACAAIANIEATHWQGSTS